MAAERYRRVDDDLDQDHREALDQAVKNVFDTDIALATFAQIIDGLPLSDVAWDTRGTKLTPQHPINLHTQLCPGTLDKARALREQFSSDLLSFKPETCDAFGLSPPSSRRSMLRLLELTAAAIHQAVVFEFPMEHNLHDSTTTRTMSVEDVTNWERPPDELVHVVPYPTLSLQSYFIAHGKYPEGVADMVGYWTEDRISGCVLLFDHSQSWDDEINPEPNAYIHPNRQTYGDFPHMSALGPATAETLRFPPKGEA